MVKQTPETVIQTVVKQTPETVTYKLVKQDTRDSHLQTGETRHQRQSLTSCDETKTSEIAPYKLWWNKNTRYSHVQAVMKQRHRQVTYKLWWNKDSRDSHVQAVVKQIHQGQSLINCDETKTPETAPYKLWWNKDTVKSRTSCDETKTPETDPYKLWWNKDTRHSHVQAVMKQRCQNNAVTYKLWLTKQRRQG